VEAFISRTLSSLLMFTGILACTIFVAMILAMLAGQFRTGSRRRPYLAFALGFAVVIAGLLNYFAWRSAEKAEVSEIAEGSMPAGDDWSFMAPVTAQIVRIDAQGLMKANFTEEALRQHEPIVVATVIEHIRDAISQQGGNPLSFDPKVVSSSTLLTVGTRKLAVFRIALGDEARIVLIEAFDGHQVVRVTCSRLGRSEILLSAGECGERVREAFGVSPSESSEASQ
jgi:hypothetical protein